MTANATSLSEREKMLQTILDVAQRMTAKLEQHGASLQSTQSDTNIPPLDLPFPHDILSWLKSASLPPLLLEQLTSKLHEKIAVLEYNHAQTYERICKKVLSLKHLPGQPASVLVNNIRQSFEASYHQHCLPLFKSQLIAAHDARQRTVQAGSGCRKKNAFNHIYTPVLEKYFEYNAFPSSADRKQLAKTCKMSEKQIGTWFQNHRARTKNRPEGRNLPTLRDRPLPVDISVESLREKMPLLYNPEHDKDESRADPDEPSDEEGAVCIISNRSPSDSIDILDIPAPPHAYPAKRGQDFGYQPFPKDENGNSNMRFPSPEWRRKPATPPKSTTPIDMDELSENFNTILHLRKYSKRRPERVGMSDVELMRAGMVCWFASRLTVPSVAPHPALIRHTTTARVSPIPSRCSSRSRSQSLTPTTPEPALQFSTPQGRRMAGLPKRVPRHAPAVHGSNSSATANSPSPNTSTRSLSSSSTRSASSSSSSSSRALSTPPSSPQTFPEIAIADLCTFNDDNEEFVNQLFPGGFTIPGADSLIPSGYSSEKWDLGIQSFNPYFGTSPPSFVQVQS